jgi:hypothetical protein
MIPTGTTGRTLAVGWDPALLVTGLYLVGALLLGAFVIALVRRWHREPGPGHLTPNDELARYQLLYEQGAISQEEFERLRTLLRGQLHKARDVPPRPAPPTGTAVKPAGPVPGEGGGPPHKPPENGVRPA